MKLVLKHNKEVCLYTESLAFDQLKKYVQT